MNYRDTSLASYVSESDSGRVGSRQREVLEVIRQLGSCSDRDIAVALGKQDLNYVRPRRFELVEKGLVEEVGKKKDGVTGKTVYVWRIV